MALFQDSTGQWYRGPDQDVAPARQDPALLSRGIVRTSAGEYLRVPATSLQYWQDEPEPPPIAPQAPAPDPEEGVSFADHARNIMANTMRAGQGIGWLMRQAGVEDLGSSVYDYWSEEVDQWESGISETAKEQWSREFVTKNEMGEWEWGDANLQTLAGLVSGSIPNLALGFGAGGVAAKGLQIAHGLTKTLQVFGNPIGRKALQETIAKGANASAAAAAGDVAAQATVKTAAAALKKLKFIDRVIGLAGFSVGEGLAGSMSSGVNVYESVLKLPPEKLASNDRYQQVFASTDEKMPYLERHQYAAETVAREASGLAGFQAGLTTGLLGAPMGAFLGSLIGKKALGMMGQTTPRAALKGSVGEAAQEFAQGAAETLIANRQRAMAGEDIDLFEGVLNQAIGGALAGGALGAGFGTLDKAPQTTQERAGGKGETKPQPKLDPLRTVAMEAAKAGVPQEEILETVEAVKRGEKPVLVAVGELRKRQIGAAANQAATSPQNDLPEPTPAQVEAGNYKKGKVTLQGLDISIENPMGSIRKSHPDAPVQWKRMTRGGHYGYIKGTTDATGEQVDVFVGPKPEAQTVFVIDQLTPDGAAYDEPKAMIGYPNALAAQRAYHANYPKGWKGLGAMTPMAMEDFKSWARSPAAKQPVAWKPETKVVPSETIPAIPATEVAPSETIAAVAATPAPIVAPEPAATVPALPKVLFETVPSKSTRAGRRISELPFERRQEFSQRAAKVIDYERLAQHVGLPAGSKAEAGRGMWQGQPNPGLIETVEGTDPPRDKIEQMARAIQYVHRQDDAGTHAPTAYIELERELTAPEQQAFDEAFVQAFGDLSYTAAGRQVVAIDFSGNGAAAWEDRLSAFNEDARSRGVHVKLDTSAVFIAETGSVKHDWQDEAGTGPGSADALLQAAAAGSPAAQEDILRARTEARRLEDEYAGPEEAVTPTPGSGESAIPDLPLSPAPARTRGAAAPPATPAAIPSVNDRLAQLLERAIRRDAMEAQGRAILDEMDDAGETPRAVATEFWDQTYPKLNDKTRGLFERQAKAMGFEPGDVLLVEKDGTRVTAKDWQDVGRFLAEEMPKRADELEGIDRGFVSLMKWANEQAARFSDQAGDTSLPLLSRGAAPGGQLASAVRETLATAIAEIAPLVDVTIAQSPAEHGFEAGIEGAFIPGQGVVLFADRLPPGRELEVFTHEVFGHLAMERTPFGRQAVDMVLALHDKQHPSIDPLWYEVSRRWGRLYLFDPTAHAKEVIALMAERGDKHAVMTRLIAGVRRFLRKLGIVREYSDAEVRDLIARSARALRVDVNQALAGKSPKLAALNPASTDEDILAALDEAIPPDVVELDAYLSRANDQTQTPEFKAWFGDSKVVDEQGKPLRVYHGTDSDFSMFKEGKGTSEGFHFTSKPSTASRFADSRAMDGGRGANVMPVYLSIVNPAYAPIITTDAIDAAKAAGHDGLINKTGDRLVAFRPEQIKSAIGNRGTFDPKNQSILFSRAAVADPSIQAIMDRVLSKAPEEFTLKDKARKLWSDLTNTDALAVKQGLIDSFASIEAMERDFTGGGLLDASQSAHKAALATKNLPSVMAAVMMAGVPDYVNGAYVPVAGRKGVLDIFKPLTEHNDGNLLRQWEAFAAANRANRLIKEKNPDGTQREKLMSQADIDELLTLEQKYPEFRAVLIEWNAFNKQMLDLAQDAGVIDPVSRAVWEKNDYVPFYRAVEDFQGPRKKKGVAGQRAQIKTLKGRDEALGNVFENMMLNTAHLLDASFKNRAMQRVVGLGIGAALQPVPFEAEAIKVTDEQLARALDKAGVTVNGLSIVQSMTPQQKAHWSTIFRRVAPTGPDIVSVMVNGKPEYYQVTDPLVLSSLTAMGHDNFADIWGLFRGSKKLLTSAITADPAFMLANFARDTLSNWVVSDASMHPFIDAIKGIKAGLATDPALLQMMMAGAGGGGYYDSNPEDIRKLISTKVPHTASKGITDAVIDTPHKAWQAWRKIGSAAENANRIAVFRAVLAKGGTVAEAAYQARDVLNFSMSGDYAAMRWLTQTVPFLNARVQGLYRLYRGARDNKRAFFIKGSMLLAATMALALRNNDREEYEEIAEWDKDLYWHFFVGGEHYRLPKPFEVGAMFATIPERIWRTASGRDSPKILMQRVGQMAMDTFAFNPVPQLVKPVIEQYANRSMFTGSPIVGMAEMRLQPEAQFTPWTSETMRELADAMPDFAPEWLRSPRRLEAALRAYTGSMGMYVLGVSDSLVRNALGYPEEPGRKIYDFPVVKRFLVDPQPRHTKYADQMYEMLDEANAVYSTINRFRREQRFEEALAMQRTNKSKLAVRVRLNRIATQARNINAQIRLVQNSRTLSASVKRERIDVLVARKNKITRDVARFADLF